MNPKLICMTPVRNEAWCLDVFLKCTSLWADHIIIADQNSIDGSREIASNYPKVKLIENNSEIYNEHDRQQLLIDEARKFEGPKILVALDADEILTANYSKTEDWKRILNSQPGDVFGFQWGNILPDKKHYFLSPFYFPWLFNDDGITEHKNYVSWIHSMRIPYPIEADKGYFKVTDFKVIHFGWFNSIRFESKNRFYQCIVSIKDPGLHFISIFRSHHSKKVKKHQIPSEWLEKYNNATTSILDQLNISQTLTWYDLYVKDLFIQHGIVKFKYLDIWDKNWIKLMKSEIKIKDPRSFWIKMIHFYLRRTTNYNNAIPIKVIDRILKLLI